MQVFRIRHAIRKIGYNYGLPCWIVDCGLGTSYTPEDLLRKLVAMGMQEKNWVVVRRGLNERGIGTFVDALSYVHCKSEVEVRSHTPTPMWFTKADRWTVFWDRESPFNFGALRRGQDMVVSEDLASLVGKFGGNDLIEKAYISGSSLTEQDLSTLAAYGIRFYQVEEDDDA